MTLRPAASNNYFATLKAAQAKFGSAWDSMKHEQTAECLYMIVTRGLDDPDVMEQFSPDEIGDVDGDGLPEFLDGWGNPIKFLRWAPAYKSPLQPDPATVTQSDPFDPLNVDPKKPTYPLYPLIYSAGPDGKFVPGGTGSGASFKPNQDTGYDIGETPKPSTDYKSIDYDPFDPKVKDNIGDQTQDIDGNGTIENIDNITNHDIGENQ